MKKIAISLIALAALSGAAAASSDRSYDNESYILQNDNAFNPQAGTDMNAFAVANDSAPLTAYERALKNAEEDENDKN